MIALRLSPPLQKLALYALCGGSGVALDFLSFAALIAFGAWYQLANITGYALGTILSFVLNRSITFGVYDAPVRRFMSFAGVAAVGYAVSSVALWFLVDRLGVGPVIAKALTLVVVLAIQFSLNLLITFRQGAKPRPGPGAKA